MAESPDDEYLGTLAEQFFQRVGGQHFFQLCRRFYELVFQDDLTPPSRAVSWFLATRGQRVGADCG